MKNFPLLANFFKDLVKTLFSNTPKFEVMNVISDIPRSIYSIESAKRKLTHTLYIRRLRDNMKENAPELDVYSKNYTQIVSFAVGEKRRQLYSEEQTLLVGSLCSNTSSANQSYLPRTADGRCIDVATFDKYNIQKVLESYGKNESIWKN